MKLSQLLQEKRQDILAIAAKHGAFNVRVFGSVTRGEETEKSDIDLLVDYDLKQIAPWFPGGLLMDLQDLLDCKNLFLSDCIFLNYFVIGHATSEGTDNYCDGDTSAF
jgi:predicted nucleotidyltransferase